MKDRVEVELAHDWFDHKAGSTVKVTAAEARQIVAGGIGIYPTKTEERKAETAPPAKA